MGFLWRAQIFLVILPLSLYVSFIALVAVPPVQRALLYAHLVNFPDPALLQNETVFGFGLGQIRHLNISSTDGVYLGAWHVLPKQIWEDEVDRNGYGSHIEEASYDAALRSAPTILYAHGNAGNRATAPRRRPARHLSAAGFNFVIFDYRGFGDSSDHVPPTEQGLVEDAKAVWDWLTITKEIIPSQIALAGASLGTGVMSALAGNMLAAEGIEPRALILLAPFTSIPQLLETYKLGTVIPLLGPLVSIPGAHKYLLRYLQTHYDSLNALRTVRCPILLVHALDDRHISHTHSQTLFDELRAQDEEDEVEKVNWGKGIGSLQRAGRLWYYEPAHGGHNAVGYTEGTLHYIRQIMQYHDTV